MQLHPLAYMVKLNIEMAMAKLITEIARDKSDIELGVSDWSQSIGLHTLPSNAPPSITIQREPQITADSGQKPGAEELA